MLLRAESVSKSFGPRDILLSVDLQIEEGDRIGLVGRNGVGKTTLIKLLMGTLIPDMGEVISRTDRIGYLPQLPVIEPGELVRNVIGTPFGDLAAVRKRLSELEGIMASGVEERGLDWNEVAAEYSKLEEELLHGDARAGSPHMSKVLEDVGLSQEIAGRRFSELSGGESTKVMLARVLMQSHDADILFLDEPTSHLDIETTEWLEDYLLTMKGAMMVVSHDRYFLDKAVTRVMELDDAQLQEYRGNYSSFVGKKAVETERKQKAFAKNRAERNRQLKIVEEQFRRNPYLTEHKTRLKMLERMDRVEAPVETKDMSLLFEAAGKSGRDVMMIKGMGVERGGRRILDSVDLYLEKGDKLGIFGPNGSGKTTLIKTLLSELPCTGNLWIAPGARIGYFAQDHDVLDRALTPEEQLLIAVGKDEKLKVRKILARFLLTGDDVERPISTLSGGERARVALAQLLSEKRNLLILDEPTNYLDILSRSAVESALQEYPGTLLVVSHDRYLLDAVCNKVGDLRDGRLKVYNGNYSQMKGQRKVREVLEDARAYRVVTGFTDWATKTKYRAGDRIVIAESEMGLYEWAFTTGKLKSIKGKKERKHVQKGSY